MQRLFSVKVCNNYSQCDGCNIYKKNWTHYCNNGYAGLTNYLSIFYLLSLFLLNCETILNPFHVSVSKQSANDSSCYNVDGLVGVESMQTYNEEKE